MIDLTDETVFCARLSSEPIEFGYLTIKDRREFIKKALEKGMIEDTNDTRLVRASDRRCIVKVPFVAGNSTDSSSRLYKVGQSIIVNRNFGFHQIGILEDY